MPINKASYSASLFAVEKPNLKDFSMVIFLGDTRTSPTLDPRWLATPSTYTSQGVGHWIEITPTDFHPRHDFPYSFSQEIQKIQPPDQREPVPL